MSVNVTTRYRSENLPDAAARYRGDAMTVSRRNRRILITALPAYNIIYTARAGRGIRTRVPIITYDVPSVNMLIVRTPTSV